MHLKARGLETTPKYSYSTDNTVFRAQVPDSDVSWDNAVPDYTPTEYSAPVLARNPVWADPMDPKSITNFNEDPRTSFTGVYGVDADTNRPINPLGRTGMSNRGCLGKWGPNYAADPIVMRRKPSDAKVLQFVAITRSDTGELDIPGGMVDFGENVSATLKREFLEETHNILEQGTDAQIAMEALVSKLFDSPTQQLYRGYVDDPRNTDNSWLETTATLFFDENGDLTKDFAFDAGDDATSVKWCDVEFENEEFKLYASHKDFIEKAVKFIESSEAF